MNITMKHYNIINTFGAVAVVRNNIDKTPQENSKVTSSSPYPFVEKHVEEHSIGFPFLDLKICI